MVADHMENQASFNDALSRDTAQLTGRDIFKVLFRRKWIILILFLSTSLFVILKASSIPTEYSATAQVLINRGQRKSALDRNVSLLTWDETVATELQIAESRPVIRAAQAMLVEEAEENGTEPIEIETKGVRSKLLGESNVVGLQYTSLIESEAPPVANALAQAYIDYHKKLFALPDATSFFAERVIEAEANLKDLTLRRQQIKEEGGVGRLSTQQDQLLHQIRVIRETMVREGQEFAGLEAEVIQARKLFFQDGVDVPFDTRRFEDNIGALHVLYRHKDALVNLRRDRDELLTLYTEQHPLAIAIDERIVFVESEMHSEAEQLIRVKERNLEVKRAELNSLRDRLAERNLELRTMPGIERAIMNLDRSIELASDAYSELLDNQVRIQVSEVASRDFTLSLLSEAGMPDATDPRDPIRLALVPAFSLLLGISLAFFVETMDHSLKSREDVERYIGLSVLASIPHRKKALTS